MKVMEGVYLYNKHSWKTEEQVENKSSSKIPYIKYI